MSDDKQIIRKVIDAVKVTTKAETKELVTDMKEIKRKVNSNYNTQALKNKDFEHELKTLDAYKKGIWALGLAAIAFLFNALLELVKK